MRQLQRRMQKLAERLLKPSPRMASEARRRAEKAAEEHGVPIDRICVIGTAFGRFHALVLPDE